MKLYFFQQLMSIAFKNHSFARIVKIHQSANGWVFIIKDELNGDEYVCQAVAVKSEKIVAPETADHIINNGGF